MFYYIPIGLKAGCIYCTGLAIRKLSMLFLDGTGTRILSYTSIHGFNFCVYTDPFSDDWNSDLLNIGFNTCVYMDSDLYDRNTGLLNILGYVSCYHLVAVNLALYPEEFLGFFGCSCSYMGCCCCLSSWMKFIKWNWNRDCRNFTFLF